MNSRRKRVSVALAALLLASLPALAQRGSRYYPERESAFRLRVGSFLPEGDSEYWNDKEEDFTGSVDDFENPSVGLDFLLPLSNRLSVQFSGSAYEGEATNSYRGFEDNFGDRIRHDTTLDIVSGTVGLVLHLTGPDVALQPYVGGGLGAYSWRLEESGDFIDFGSSSRPVFSADLESEGTTFGYYWLVGLEAPLSPRLSLFAEGRWTDAEDDLADDFEGFGKLDLSGRELAAGLSWKL